MEEKNVKNYLNGCWVKSTNLKKCKAIMIEKLYIFLAVLLIKFILVHFEKFVKFQLISKSWKYVKNYLSGWILQAPLTWVKPSIVREFAQFEISTSTL